MFTITADALSAILDKVTPHHLTARDTDGLDVVVLDCTRSWLHAIGAGPRTIAVARTPIQNSGHWTAPIDYDEVLALRAWLDTSDHVHVEHTTDNGRPLLRFTEGPAQITMPVLTDAPKLPWRHIVRLEGHSPKTAPRPVRISAEGLALWESAAQNIEVWPAAGVAAFVVTAGPDFIGVQLPKAETVNGNALDGWTASLRTRWFLHEGLPYEVGAGYADRWGMVWRILARPAPGQEPTAVTADPSGAALPLSVVLNVGGPLLRIHA
ncbi:hypothetical protein [Streptomyces sp. S.PNR 29]|uniref:hypothetical protein n=1 Tax=Streptomyces sp. S.PNR 29 TaxID=2973805 RepID=UPI0025AF50CC|nr:hypothetical protein [Streptomyces sp. S.PNR 29]MDN0193940.1 hypothetical protein [Streptomyces sp. S.PNR 29]